MNSITLPLSEKHSYIWIFSQSHNLIFSQLQLCMKLSKVDYFHLKMCVSQLLLKMTSAYTITNLNLLLKLQHPCKHWAVYQFRPNTSIYIQFNLLLYLLSTSVYCKCCQAKVAASLSDQLVTMLTDDTQQPPTVVVLATTYVDIKNKLCSCPCQCLLVFFYCFVLQITKRHLESNS